MPPKGDENDKTKKQAASLGSRSKNKGELDLNLPSRRPLSPISNPTSSMKVNRGIKTNNREPIIQQEQRVSEPSKNDSMEVDSIDERALPMLIDNGDDAIS